MPEGENSFVMLSKVLSPFIDEGLWITKIDKTPALYNVQLNNYSEKRLELGVKLKLINLPCKIVNCALDGKQIVLRLRSCCGDTQVLKFSLGQGSYFSLYEKDDKQYYPYTSLMEMAFETESGRGVALLSSEQFSGFAHWSLDEYAREVPRVGGYCVLTEHEKFVKKFLTLKSNTRFGERSLVSILFDPDICNGFGPWMVSEGLMRLWLAFNIGPHTKASFLFEDRNANVLKAFLWLGPSLSEENSLYTDNYNPANFGKNQAKSSQDWRIHFRLVFSKPTYRGKEVVAFKIKTKQGLSPFYALREAFLPESIPPVDEMVPFIQNEQWMVVKGNYFTPKSLQVGDYEWHSNKGYKLLLTEGHPINKTMPERVFKDKYTSVTEEQLVIQSENSSKKRKKKNKRTQLHEKRAKYASGEYLKADHPSYYVPHL